MIVAEKRQIHRFNNSTFRKFRLLDYCTSVFEFLKQYTHNAFYTYIKHDPYQIVQVLSIDAYAKYAKYVCTWNLKVSIYYIFDILYKFNEVELSICIFVQSSLSCCKAQPMI